MPDSTTSNPAAGADPQGLAVTAEALFLVNLMLLPFLAFALLLALYFRRRASAAPLALSHLQQTVSASLWGGVLLVAAIAAMIVVGGHDRADTWLVVILYFTFCHSSLILLGIVGLAKAMAGRCWRYPLVGRPLPPGCAS